MLFAIKSVNESRELKKSEIRNAQEMLSTCVEHCVVSSYILTLDMCVSGILGKRNLRSASHVVDMVAKSDEEVEKQLATTGMHL
jgi:hypothetical protein